MTTDDETEMKCPMHPNRGEMYVTGTAGKGIGEIMVCSYCGYRTTRYYKRGDPRRDDNHPNWQYITEPESEETMTDQKADKPNEIGEARSMMIEVRSPRAPSEDPSICISLDGSEYDSIKREARLGLPRREQTMNENNDPAVDRPRHYGGDECMKLLESGGLARNGCLFNIGKYLFRFRAKAHPLQDVQKALWYAERLLENKAYGEPIKVEENTAIVFCQINGTELPEPPVYDAQMDDAIQKVVTRILDILLELQELPK